MIARGHYLEPICQNSPPPPGLPPEGDCPPVDGWLSHSYTGQLPDSVAVPLMRCGSWAAEGTCDGGHRLLHPILCGREWCDTCGKQWSPAHMRRVARLLPRARQIRDLGYWVITWPLESRQALRDPQELARLGRRCAQILRACGQIRGLRRWHFFGDLSSRWNPHLNVLVEDGFIPPDRLRAIKDRLRAALGAGVIHYQFVRRDDPKRVQKIMHRLRYICRATFRDARWDPEMAVKLKGFRNTSWWGTWRDDPDWEPPERSDEADVAAGVCPVCRAPISWSPALVRVRDVEESSSLHLVRDLILVLPRAGPGEGG